MTLKAQAARGVKWQILDIFGRQLISMTVFAALARMLDPSDFGLAGLVALYLAFITLLVDQGIGTAIIQRREVAPDHLNAAFVFNLSCSLALFLATFVTADFISLYFREPRLTPLLRVASVSLIINALSSVHGPLLTRELDFRRLASRNVIANLAGGTVGVALAFRGAGAWSLVWQQLTTSAAGTCFLWGTASWRPSARFSLQHFKDLFGVSSSVFISVLLWFFCSRLDQVFVGRYYGATTLGGYVIAVKLTEIVKTITHQPIAAVSLPMLTRLQDDRTRMCNAIYRGMELNAVICFAFFCGLALVATDLIAVVFGDRWETAGLACSVLCIYMLVISLEVFTFPALLASGKLKSYLVINLFYALGVVTACTVCAPFGPVSIATGLLLNALVMSVPVFAFLRKYVSLDVGAYLRPCVTPALAASGMAISIYALQFCWGRDSHLAARVVAEIILGAAVYIVCLLVLNPRSLHELLSMVAHAVKPKHGISASAESPG